jgi:hypothetical protein
VPVHLDEIGTRNAQVLCQQDGRLALNSGSVRESAQRITEPGPERLM